MGSSKVSGDDGGSDAAEARAPQARGLPLPAGPGEAAVWTGRGGPRGRKRKHECSERQLEAQPGQLLGWEHFYYNSLPTASSRVSNGNVVNENYAKATLGSE